MEKPVVIVNPLSSSHKFISILSALLFFASGIVLLSISNNNFDVLVVAFVFLILGLLLVAICRGSWFEYRAFFLCFSLCVFIAGLSQYYSTNVFNQIMSTPDANTFFNLLKSNPSYSSLDALKKIVNAPLAVAIWEVIYSFFNVLGFSSENYIGIFFNAAIMGISSVLTVKIGREIFGQNEYRLNKIGTLFAFCGLTWLFGSLFIRDCYAVFFNTLALWGLVKCLNKVNLFNIMLLVVLFFISAYCLYYLREESIYIVILFYFIAFSVWYLKKGLTAPSILFISIALIILVIAFHSKIYNFTNDALDTTSAGREQYGGFAKGMHNSDSLGFNLVVNQPLPIRAIMGVGYLLLHPIPVWGYFKWGLGEYYWIKGWQGFFMLYLFPLAYVGTKNVFFKNPEYSIKTNIVSFYFIILYTVASFLLVAITSLETRHFGQFIPAMIILATIPETNKLKDSRQVNQALKSWLGIVTILHLTWFGLRFI